MNRIRLPLLVLGILSISQWPMGVRVATADGQATRAHVLVLDVAADCRTYAPTTARGETNMVTGKIFPGGTLPSGTASNDPVLPVNGVAPIGDWHHRSQNVLPLPADIADAYGSAPPVLSHLLLLPRRRASVGQRKLGTRDDQRYPLGSGCHHRWLRRLQRRRR